MIMFKNLVKQGALTSDYKGGKGFTRLWDECSSYSIPALGNRWRSRLI